MKTEPKPSRLSDIKVTSGQSTKNPSVYTGWRLMLVFAGLLALLYFINSHPLSESDPASRNAFALVVALATEHHPAIDSFVTAPGGGFLAQPGEAYNLAYFAGHYYSASPPGAALLGVPFYLLGRFFGEAGSAAFVQIIQALSAALTMLLAFGAARRMGSSIAAARYGALLLGFSSALWRAGEHFGPGVFSLLLLAASIWLALPPLPRDEQQEAINYPPLLRSLALGLALGFAVVVDYPNLLWTPLFAGYLLWGRRLNIRNGALIVLGWVAGLLPLPLYNWWAFGKPWTFSYGFLLTDPQSRSLSGQFLGGFRPGNIWDTLFGPGQAMLGFFLLLFGIWGLIALYGQRGKRHEATLFIALVILTFVEALLRRPLGSGELRADFALVLLLPLAFGAGVWYERFMFLTRLEMWWLPGLALTGSALYYFLASPGILSNLGGLIYVLPFAILLALAFLLWRITPRVSPVSKAFAGLVALLLVSLLLLAGSLETRPAFAANEANNLIYNSQLQCENQTIAGWYLGDTVPACASPLNLKAGQTLQPYLIPVQGGKLYTLQFEASGQGQLEWHWTDDSHQPVVINDSPFTPSFGEAWNKGSFKDSRAAPPGAAYLQLLFKAGTAGSLGNFRLFDQGVRLEPMPNYAKAALSFTFDWETAMGGLIHSQGGSPAPGEGGENTGQGITPENLKAAISDAENRGLNMRKGADFLLDIFSRNNIRGTFYANGYNLLDGNTQKKQFLGNPIYKWASTKNNWISDFWTKTPWYGLDPYGDDKTSPAWYFGDQTERMKAAGQDIESHTFGHLYVRGTTPQEFAQDEDEFLYYANQKGLPQISSFAFPWKSSNSVGAEWYKALADRGFTSITRQYDFNQQVRVGSNSQLLFDNGKRTDTNQVKFEATPGPNNYYYYLSRIKDEPRLLDLHDYQLIPTQASEDFAHSLVDELLRRRGYGSIWNHPEAIVDANEQARWTHIIEYAVQKRSEGLWVDSVTNIIKYRHDVEQVATSQTWSDGGKKLSLTLTNHSPDTVEGLTLTLPAQIKAANGVAGFKGAQAVAPAIASGQTITINLEF
ncbi:MAG TPA: hypothetical protein VH186_13455 [Chloroflexia bacterium]|nr:hypothetical protein [Chloroflexia bacterium]